MLSLHGVNKSSSGLYRCQILDLDDMTQMEKEVELVVNCKAPGGRGGTGEARSRGNGAPRSPCSRCPALRVPPRHRRGAGADGALLAPERRGQREAELQRTQPRGPGLPVDGREGERHPGSSEGRIFPFPPPRLALGGPVGQVGGSAPWIVPPQQGRKVAEGNQLVLRNLTFETSSNFSCQAVARSVPGLERSKQVAVAVQGKE